MYKVSKRSVFNIFYYSECYILSLWVGYRWSVFKGPHTGKIESDSVDIVELPWVLISEDIFIRIDNLNDLIYVEEQKFHYLNF